MEDPLGKNLGIVFWAYKSHVFYLYAVDHSYLIGNAISVFSYKIQLLVQNRACVCVCLCGGKWVVGNLTQWHRLSAETLCDEGAISE